MNKNFKRNLSGQSTYECGCCHRQTRETGHGEQSVELCAFCYEVAGMENEHSDGYTTDAEFTAKVRALIKQYGKRAHLDCVTLPEEPALGAPVTGLLVTPAENIAQLKALKDAWTVAIKGARKDGADADT